MRDLSEYRAEIFRRSEEKIHARKKRRAIALGTGIPVCLCALVILSATVAGPFLASKVSNSTEMIQPDGIQDADMQGSLRKEYTVTDPETADAVLALLEEVTPEVPEAAPPDIQAGRDPADYGCPDDVYYIRLSLGNDVETVYWVEGTYVWNMTTGEFLNISGQNAARLIQLLKEE